MLVGSSFEKELIKARMQGPRTVEPAIFFNDCPLAIILPIGDENSVVVDSSTVPQCSNHSQDGLHTFAVPFGDPSGA